MPLTEISIGNGTFKTKHDRALRNSDFADDFINMMIGPAKENFSRPTLDHFVDLASTEPIGMTFFQNLIVVVTADRKFYTVDMSGVKVDITGQTLPGVERPTFTTDGTTLFIAGGGAPVKWAGIGNTTALLGGSPPNMTHIVFLDGYLIGNRRLDSEGNKVMQFSDQGTTETWTATNIFSAVADPDQVQGTTVSQREIYVVGEVTTEVWQNIGTSPVPFARAYVWQYGTPAKYSICEADNSVFFLEQTRRIMRISGREIVRVSEAIENELATYETVTDCWSASFGWAGTICVLFVFPTAGRAWCLDLRNGQWYDWRGYNSGLSRLRLNCLIDVRGLGRVFGGDFASEKLWEFSDSETTDAGGIMVQRRTFAQRDGGASVRKRANLVRFNMERNIASAYDGTESETNPIVEMRWKDDDKPWTAFRQVNVGTRGTNKYYIDFWRLGVYRTRQYEFQCSDPVRLTIVSVETDETVMAA